MNFLIASGGVLAAKDIDQIRKKLTQILGIFFDQVKLTLTSFSKLLYLTLFWLVFDALNYMRRYYSDDSFDNACIDESLGQFWENNEKVPLTPLRYWELNEKYHYVTSAKLSLHEIKEMALHSIPTIIVATGIMAIRFSDIGLFEVCMGL